MEIHRPEEYKQRLKSGGIPPLDLHERCKLEYKEVREHIRHFSNLMYALTSFLLAFGMIVLGIYHTTGKNYFMFTGFIALAGALIVCFVFSFRTEWWTIYSHKLWNGFLHGYDSKNDVPVGVMSRDAVAKSRIYRKMLRDPMNWAVVVALGLVVWGLFASLNY
jgi:hypothetical protein